MKLHIKMIYASKAIVISLDAVKINALKSTLRSLEDLKSVYEVTK